MWASSALYDDIERNDIDPSLLGECEPLEKDLSLFTPMCWVAREPDLAHKTGALALPALVPTCLLTCARGAAHLKWAVQSQFKEPVVVATRQRRRAYGSLSWEEYVELQNEEKVAGDELFLFTQECWELQESARPGTPPLPPMRKRIREGGVD